MKSKRNRNKPVNSFKYAEIDGEVVVIFTTNGKYKVDVIVDEDYWVNYINKYSWTACRKADGRFEVRTNINGASKILYRLIAEKVYGELLIYGRQIDHKNRNHLDNRKSNLRPVCQRLNTNNITSKNEHIFTVKNNTKKRGYFETYKVNMNINGESYYEHFKTIEEAELYRDMVLYPLKAQEMLNIMKKDRDIEFERGLLLKIQSNELDEVYQILGKYNIAK